MWHRTFTDLRFVLQNLYIRKQVTRFWGRVEGSCQNGCIKGSGGPQPSYPSLLRPICFDRRVSNSQLSPTPCYHREEGRRRTQQKRTFRVAVIIADKKRVLYFLPLPSSLSISFSVDFFLYNTKRWAYGTQTRYHNIDNFLPHHIIVNIFSWNKICQNPFLPNPSQLFSYLLPKIYLHFHSPRNLMKPDPFDFKSLPTFPATTIPSPTSYHFSSHAFK